MAALILSAASNYLKDRQIINTEIDMKKNILTAVGLSRDEGCDQKGSDANKNLCCNTLDCYQNNIRSLIIDLNGKIKKSENAPEKINIMHEMAKPADQRSYPVFQRVKDGKITTYCIPLFGKGLWGRIYGYIALQVDLNTIQGISFYKHSETPGLGARIEESWFSNNFKGKNILDSSGNFVSVSVIKGKVLKESRNYIHEVDGITGATITSKAVSDCIKDCLTIYEPYFKLIRKGAK